MRKYVMAAAAAGAIAMPALAASGPYVGIEGGVTLPQSTNYDVTVKNGTTTTTYDNGYHARYKTSYDVDLLAGYKLGLLRLEAEGGYQRAKVKGLDVSSQLLAIISASKS
jgi:hypothetical protein